MSITLEVIAAEIQAVKDANPDWIMNPVWGGVDKVANG